MVIKSAPCLSFAGNTTVEFSQEGWQILLGQIETELYRSESYNYAVVSFHNLLPEAVQEAQLLLQSVARQAIKLALTRFTDPTQTSITPPAIPDRHQVGEESPPRPTYPLAHHPSELDHSHSFVWGNHHIQTTSLPHRVTDAPTEPVVPADHPNTWSAILNNLVQEHKKPVDLVTQEKEKEKEREQCLRHLGEEIRINRQARSLSIYELTRQTLVPANMIDALETGRTDLLPEDIYVRGFIRHLGDALELNGAKMAASVPATDSLKNIIPSWYKPVPPKNFQIKPVHLYVGYAALVAGALSSITWLSQQPKSEPIFKPEPSLPYSPSSHLFKSAAPISTPGLKFSSIGLVAGNDLVPPEMIFNIF